MGLPLLVLLAFVPAGRPAPATAVLATVTSGATGDEQAFRDAFLDPTGSAVLDFFRDRANPPETRQIAALVQDLGAADAATRDRSAGALVRAGAAAVPQLRTAANGIENEEAAKRARQCLGLIEGRDGRRLARAATHLAASIRPAGAAAVLLAYLPFADDDEVAREVEEALAAVSRRDGRPDPALLAAITDAVPMRRAAAARALCRGGDAEDIAAVRPLLKDPAASVRLRAALGMAGHNEAEAVPTLIDLLEDDVPDRRREAEGFLSQLAGDWAIVTPRGDDGISARLRREAWSSWWRSVDGAALLNELRSRTLTDAELDRIHTLIRQLDDSSAETRDTAAAAIMEMGTRVAPQVRRAAREGGRAGELATACLEGIEVGRPRLLPGAISRLLALRRPAGTVETVLAYLPCADSDETEASLGEVLSAAGFREGRPPAALVAALTDKVGVRRAAAAEALCGAGGEQMPSVRKLLSDADPDVRLRSALALARARDVRAVPILIDLLVSHPKLDKAADAEDFLVRVADIKGPEVSLGSDGSDRIKARDAWATWWKTHESTIDLSRLEATPRRLGYLLVVDFNISGGAGYGRVTELDREHKPRWQVGNLMGPCDACVLPGDRVLVAEQNANRVTERDLAGKVLWERAVPMAFQCQRLRNGNTFAAGRNLLVEIDPNGKQVFRLQRTEYLVSARRFRDGQTAFFTQQGNYVRLDASGREVKSFRLTLPGNPGFAAAEVLPRDRVVVSVSQENRVAEYDSDGKVVWEATVPTPGNPTRLSSGNTLVVNANGGRITELNRHGKVVGEWNDLPVRPLRVDRR